VIESVFIAILTQRFFGKRLRAERLLSADNVTSLEAYLVASILEAYSDVRAIKSF
jgi:hypothetical protein